MEAFQKLALNQIVVGVTHELSVCAMDSDREEEQTVDHAALYMLINKTLSRSCNNSPWRRLRDVKAEGRP